MCHKFRRIKAEEEFGRLSLGEPFSISHAIAKAVAARVGVGRAPPASPIQAVTGR